MYINNQCTLLNDTFDGLIAVESNLIISQFNSHKEREINFRYTVMIKSLWGVHVPRLTSFIYHRVLYSRSRYLKSRRLIKLISNHSQTFVMRYVVLIIHFY